jgi:hypothetical protein
VAIRRNLPGLALAVVALSAFGGCGGSSSSTPSIPTIRAARTFDLVGFQPAGPAVAGRPVTVAFTIRQPDGKPLTDYRRGSGPHTGVHLIIVRDDLATIIHRHPPVAADGRISELITFAQPGRYRVVVDAYPNVSGPQRNFQLFHTIHVGGHVGGDTAPKPLPPFQPSVDIDGYRVTLHGHPRLEAIQAGFLTITVTDPNGKPARFTPWYGALAHAIFFRARTLDYFHTHVCAPGASGCASFLGGAAVAGSSSTPGRLRVGVLVPVPGTWRLFLQCRANGHILTAPFTLEVR